MVLVAEPIILSNSHGASPRVRSRPPRTTRSTSCVRYRAIDTLPHPPIFSPRYMQAPLYPDPWKPESPSLDELALVKDILSVEARSGLSLTLCKLSEPKGRSRLV